MSVTGTRMKSTRCTSIMRRVPPVSEKTRNRRALPGACPSSPGSLHNPSMHIFLQTERLQLRRFTDDDVENLVELDSDPEVMRFINGGRPTSRDEIENDVLPAFLDYYKRSAGYGFWAAVEKS